MVHPEKRARKRRRGYACLVLSLRNDERSFLLPAVVSSASKQPKKLLGKCLLPRLSHARLATSSPLLEKQSPFALSDSTMGPADLSLLLLSMEKQKKIFDAVVPAHFPLKLPFVCSGL